MSSENDRTILNIAGAILYGYILASKLAAGDPFFLASIIGAFVAIYSANVCFTWANKIERNHVGAYLIGLSLSLVGLLLYYIYYRITKKKFSPIPLSKKKRR